MKMTKEIAVGFGGNVWAKDGVELRVYFNKDAVLKMAEGVQILPSEVKAAEKAKTYLDLKTGEMKSDTGLVRTLIKSSGFECSK